MNYQVQSHDYTNTGGGCMVSTFQVWLSDENKTLFVHVNEEDVTLATCDYINYDIDYEERTQIETVRIKELDKTNQYFELYRYCVLEYVKRNCKRYNYNVYLTYDMLPDNLQQELTAEYLKWHYENIGNTFETDGYDLFLSEEYVEPDAEILKAESMLQYMEDAINKIVDDDDAKLLERFYNSKIIIGFGDKVTIFDNRAALYNALTNCLKEFIDNY
jgi:hypothetical protein